MPTRRKTFAMVSEELDGGRRSTEKGATAKISRKLVAQAV